MRATTRFTISAVIVLTIATSVEAEHPRGKPKHASIAIVPSPFDSFLIQTGNVKVTFRDGHTEMLTHSGDCHDVKLSPAGNVGWVRMDKNSVDAQRMTIAGKDCLVIRLLDGTLKKFPPFDDNVRIMDWRFADHDTAVVIRSMGHHGPSSYVKYDLASGTVRASRGSYTPYDKLPSWAKPLAGPKND